MKLSIGIFCTFSLKDEILVDAIERNLVAQGFDAHAVSAEDPLEKETQTAALIYILDETDTRAERTALEFCQRWLDATRKANILLVTNDCNAAYEAFRPYMALRFDPDLDFASFLRRGIKVPETSYIERICIYARQIATGTNSIAPSPSSTIPSV